MFRSSREIREALRVHFRDRFPCLPDLPLQDFRIYHTEFPCFQEAEAAGCEGLVTEYEHRVKDSDSDLGELFADCCRGLDRTRTELRC